MFEYDTIFDVGVKIDIFAFLHFRCYFGLELLSQKRMLSVIFPTKC